MDCKVIFFSTALLLIVREASNNQLGDFHTSTAFIERLVRMEDRVVDLLSDYLRREREQLDVVTRYIDDWHSNSLDQYIENPLGSYHLFKRLIYEFPLVERAISKAGALEVLGATKKVRNSIKLPSESDISGAAWAIVHLQDVYNLPIDDVIYGIIHFARKLKGLKADDCFRFGEESFKNLAFDLSEKWTEKGIKFLERNNFSREAQNKIEKQRDLIVKRRIMKEFVLAMARETDDKVYQEFSGLGIPKSFTKSLYEREGVAEDIENFEKGYNMLCRGDAVQNARKSKDLYCYYSYGNPDVPFRPFKSEQITKDIQMTIYHDILTDEEISQLKELTTPVMKTAHVKSYATIRNIKSIARIGKSAYLHKEEHPLVKRLMKRVEVMTGLNTHYAHELHVLNYGVGGVYELHVDFFDFANRKNIKDSTAYQGDQVATILFYLNDVEFGGSTVFPFIRAAVKPQKGAVLVWYNLHRNGAGNFKTMHSSCPILLGQKWIATLWLNEKGHEFTRPCLLDPTQ